MSTKPTINLLHLYPQEMNIYGDFGNTLTLVRRLTWHGFAVRQLEHHPGKPFPNDVDIIVGGGGQDSGQSKVQHDLLAIGDELHKLADDGVPMLMICGLYQLFGRFFKTQNDEIIKGIEIFQAETHASNTRMIGNVVYQTAFGEVVGYENHSGKTFLDDHDTAFGQVIKGAGNNGEDTTEGCVYKNVYGTYSHGSVLPKNPLFADSLIEKAAIKKFEAFNPRPINDTIAEAARTVALKLPR